MRRWKRVRCGLGGAAMCAALTFVAGTASGQSLGDATVRTEAAETSLELEAITLYRSGVGYFVHRGEVSGDGFARFRFEAEKMNDVLKSLVVLDDGGGEVGAVRYASKEPASRRLAGLGIDIAAVGSVEGLLRQLRGEHVSIESNNGDFSGLVLAVEERMTPLVTDGAVGHFREPYVSLVTGEGVRSVAVSAIEALEIDDSGLADELARGLEILSESRGEQTREIEVELRGERDGRSVIAAYTHETPVWKPTYRLVLNDGDGGGTLQAWAIVENMTESDWEDVRLTLATGRPMGFVMDLWEPLFVARPEIGVPVAEVLAGRVFGRALGAATELADGMARSNRAESELTARGRGGRLESMRQAESFLGMSGGVASGGEAGETFAFTVDMPVTIKRRSSAMLPLVTAGVEARRVSVWSAGSGEHPVRGVEIANTSGVPMLPGPMSVIDGGAYAGDAQVGAIARGEDRLIGYAIDTEVSVSERRGEEQRITRVQIWDGRVYWSNASERTTTYEWRNVDGDDDRLLVIEHPRNDRWTLETKQPAETTAGVYRFEVDLGPGESGVFEVKEARTWNTTVALLDADLDRIAHYTREGKAPERVLEAAERAFELKRELDAARDAASRVEGRIAEIGREQERIRANMGSIDRQSELYKRYLERLSDQEDELVELRDTLAEARTSVNERQRALDEYVRTLRVR